MGKHSYDSKTKDKNSSFKIILILLIFIFIITIGNLFTTNFIYMNQKYRSISNKNTSNRQSKNEPTVTGIAEFSDNLRVENAEYLIIQDFNINNTNPEFPKISANVFNNSDEVQNDINLTISLLDENKNVITTLTYSFDEIEVNNSKILYTVLKRNLTNCTYYSASINK